MMIRPVLILALMVPAGGAADSPRAPLDLALSPDGRWALTANSRSGSVTLVDLLEGKAAAEVQVGSRPFAVAWGGSVAVVTNFRSDSITVLEVDPPRLRAGAEIRVGDEPRGVAVSRDGRRAWVALSGEDAVVAVDLETKRVTARGDAGDEPWHLAASPDGSRLAVSNALSQTVTVMDAASLRVRHAAPMRGHNLRHVAASPDGEWAYVPNIAERGLGTTRDNIDRGWVVASRLSRVPLRAEGPREAISLDPRGKAVGDADGVAVGPDGARFAVACGGTHELLLLRAPLPFVAFGGPGDHIDSALLKDATRFRRVALGGRPLGCAFTPDGRRVVVANALLDAVQVVDFDTGAVAATIPLGAPGEPSLARRGEAIFYDATRSFHQWYSCHTCHVDGHTNGSTFDTTNDGRYGNPKKTLSLRGVARTGPWTWHGWQTDLRASTAHSMQTTMQGQPLTRDDLDALLAFLGTVDFEPPPPPQPPEAVRRGEAVFRSKACDACHVAPDYTSDEVFKVGLEAPDDAYPGFNPPPLRGVGTRGPWLHDGRAKSLEDVLRVHHRPLKLGGKPDCTPDELSDLLAFLRSL